MINQLLLFFITITFTKLATPSYQSLNQAEAKQSYQNLNQPGSTPSYQYINMPGVPMYLTHHQPMYNQQPVIMPLMGLSENPMQMQCPSCRAVIVTRIDHQYGLLTWLICSGFCIFG